MFVVFVEDGRFCVLFFLKFEFFKILMFYEDIRCYVGCKECVNCIVVCNLKGIENEIFSFGIIFYLN